MIHKNVLLQTLSKGLDGKIKLIMNCYIYKKIHKDSKYIIKKDPSFICLCFDKLIIVSEDFNEKKIIVSYENIEKISWDSESQNDLMISQIEVQIDDKLYTLDKSFYFGFNNSRSNFVKSLITYSGIYFIQTQGIIKDLPIFTNEKLLFSNGSKRPFELNFIPNQVEGCLKQSYKNYTFYLKNNPKKIKENEYKFIVEKNGETYEDNFKILVKF